MIKFVRYFFIITLCATACGCFPYHYTERPGIEGTVVNEETKDPVSDAVISLEQREKTIVGSSDVDGSFFVLPKRVWGIWIIPQDVFAFPWEVCFSQDGYETNCFEFNFSPASTGKASSRQLGVIPLKPSKK